jgi:hypothetical protein
MKTTTYDLLKSFAKLCIQRDIYPLGQPVLVVLVCVVRRVLHAVRVALGLLRRYPLCYELLE